MQIPGGSGPPDPPLDPRMYCKTFIIIQLNDSYLIVVELSAQTLLHMSRVTFSRFCNREFDSKMTYSRTWGLWFDCLHKQKENAHDLLHTLGSWVIYYVFIEFQNGKNFDMLSKIMLSF